MTKPEPAWRKVACPTCGAAAGESCGKVPMGVPWDWVRVAPHVARVRAAREVEKLLGEGR